MPPQLEIVEESPAHAEAIRRVHRLGFGRDDEGLLVDHLRGDGLAVVSLVALEAGLVAGHILFSRLPIETSTGVVAAVALAPMAVLPDRRRRGIGSALVRQGLDLCRSRGERIVVVLGHPEYYPRFGFSAPLARTLQAPFSGDAFMALELAEGALSGLSGVVRYPPAFGV